MTDTIAYNIGFNPIWYIANNLGLPAAGAYLQATSSLNPTSTKYVYRDSAGPSGAGAWPMVPVPNQPADVLGIQFNANGQQGPFYFSYDPDNTDDLYDLAVYDSSGNLIWTVINYNPVADSGGSVITEVQNAQNFVINPIFYRNIGSVASIASTAFKIAPGAHGGLAATPANANPDIWFIKTNTSATDSLSFPNFTFGVPEFGTDITPPFYLNYQCTSAGSSETTKVIRIPIMQNVTTFSGTQVTVTCWVNNLNISSAITLTPSWWQFFGDGSPATTPVTTSIASWTIAADSGWIKQSATVTIPSVVYSPTAAVVGPCFNDGLFLQIGLPLNATCNVGITKPSVYLNSVSVATDYVTYDQIDAVTNSPRTGHLVASIDTTGPLGYLVMNDTTIGSASSGATTANNYTFPLYNLLWNGTSANPTFAPVTGGRGVSAIADFSANKPIQLLYALGAVIGNTGLPNSSTYPNSTTTWPLGSPNGADKIALTAAQLPPHVHTYTGLSGVGAGGLAATTGFLNTTLNTGSGPGTSSLVTIDQPRVRFNYFIKL